MSEIDVYTAWWCPGSLKAKNLLDTLHIGFREIEVTKDDAAYDEMVARTGGQTLPQIVIDGEPIGGWDDLVRLKAAGGLEGLRRP